MITVERLQEMLDLQEQLEIHISGKDWRDQGHNYPLCVHMECAEIIDKYGWKHWKHQECDMPGITMEIVDVWHFCMAFWLLDNPDSAKDLHNTIVAAGIEYAIHPAPDFIDACVGMSFAMFTVNSIPMGNLIAIMARAKLSFEQLYKLYISKNVLNRFRQDNGYKTGEYRKVWSDGREDNDHLMELAESRDVTAETLYVLLKTAYDRDQSAG